MSRVNTLDPTPSDLHVRQVRDLTVWEDGDSVYVVACDANASVGELSNDFMSRPPEEAGYNATKVALMEVLASGATPILVTNALCGPLDEYGKRVVSGVRQALAEVGSDAYVTGSDETNMTTSQTGIGVTILGRAKRGELRLATSTAGDLVACVGLPKDGVLVPYREGDDDVASPRDVVAILQAMVHEVLPVGSKGVAFEVSQLAEAAGLGFTMRDNSAIAVAASAGASTCVIVSVAPEHLDELTRAVALPVEVVATLESHMTATS